MNGDRHVQVGRDAESNIILTGNRNRVVIVQTARLLEPEPSPETPALGPNPYRGLSAFTEQDADHFFGREILTQHLWAIFRELHDPQPDKPAPLRLLPILGPSGSGKSSVARAGLLPELARRPLPGLQTPRVAVITPGAHPLEALAAVLARIATKDPVPVAKTREFTGELKQPNAQGEYDGLRRIAEALPDIATFPLIVLVDQFEEIYSLSDDASERDLFVANLLHAAVDQAARVSVVLTLRSDFLGETQYHPALNHAIAERGVIVPAMSQEELRSAIAEPASRAGRPIDIATVELLISETEGREGALPLLQFALTRIWEGMAGDVEPAITLQRIGGVGGALAAEAQRLYQGLSEVNQAIVRRAFLRLVRLGEGTRVSRRRLPISEIVAHGEDPGQVLDVLRIFSQPGARLMTLSAIYDATDAAKVTHEAEVTHEALLEHWDALKDWLETSRNDLRFHRRLAEAAKHWQERGHPDGLLWRPPDLDLLRDFHRRAGHDMTPIQVDFSQASLALQEKEKKQQRKATRFRRCAVGSIVLVIIAALGIGLWSQRQIVVERTQRLRQAEEFAQEQQRLADEADRRRREAEEARAEAETARKKAEKEKRRAESALLAEKTQRLRNQLSQAEDIEDRRQALGELFKIGPPAAPVLVEALDLNQYREVIWDVGSYLIELSLPSLVRGLIARLRIALVFPWKYPPERLGYRPDQSAQYYSRIIEPVNLINDVVSTVIQNMGARATGPLIEAVRDTYRDRENYHPAAVKLITATLSRIGEPAVPFLIDALKDPSIYIRVFALKTLAKTGPPAKLVVPAITDLLTNPDPAVHYYSRFALAQVHQEAALGIDELIMALQSNEADVQISAADQLRRHPEAAKAIPALEALLNAQNSKVRQAALDALGHMGTQAKDVSSLLIEMLGKKGKEDRKAIIRTVGEIGETTEDGVKTLVDLALYGDTEERLVAIQALGKIRPTAQSTITALLTVLEDSNFNARDAAVEAIGEIGRYDSTAVSPLLVELDRGRYTSYLTTALGKMGVNAQAAVPALIATLQNSKVSVRRAAIEALGKISTGADDAAAVLVSILRDQSNPERDAAIRALGSIISEVEDATDWAKKEVAVTAVIAALKDKDPQISRAAIEALGAVPAMTEHIMPHFIDLLQTDDAKLVPVVEKTLVKLSVTSTAVVPDLFGLVKDRKPGYLPAMRALGKMTSETLEKFAGIAVPALTEMVARAEKTERLLALEALGSIGASAHTAVPTIAGLVDSADTQVRRSAVKALANIHLGDARAVTALIQGLKDASVRRDAAVAFRSMRSKSRDTVQLLVDATKDDDWYVRERVADALVSIGYDNEEVVPTILRFLDNASADEKRPIVQILRDMGPKAKPAVPALIAAVDGEDADLKRDVIRLLMTLPVRSDAVARFLVSCLKDEDRGVKISAVSALRQLRLRQPFVLPALEAVLSNGEPSFEKAVKDAIKRLSENAIDRGD